MTLIYWSMQSIPELSAVSKRDRADVVKLCLSKTPGFAQFATIVVVTFVLLVLAQRFGVATDGWRGILTAAVAALLAGFVGVQVRTRQLRRVVSEHLRSNNAGTLRPPSTGV